MERNRGSQVQLNSQPSAPVARHVNDPVLKVYTPTLISTVPTEVIGAKMNFPHGALLKLHIYKQISHPYGLNLLFGGGFITQQYIDRTVQVHTYACLIQLKLC